VIASAATITVNVAPKRPDTRHRARIAASPIENFSLITFDTPARLKVALTRKTFCAGRNMELSELQHAMEVTYGARDRARGVPATVAWLAEEVGELAKAARKGTREEQLHELGDALAWLASLANRLGLSLDDAAKRYASGCPRCGSSPCNCPM
jgi:NTP pyrophosphatase (non-canonical NTP hydrolase)